jgi:CRP-like cAMP-binding protein
VRAGDPGDAFYVLLNGGAEVETPEGRVRTLAEGDYFGELSLIDGAPRAATVCAAGVVTAARISRDEFRELLADEPELAVGLLPGLATVARDLLRADAERIPDHGQVGDWKRAAEDGPASSEAAGEFLEGRAALGWLLLLRHVGVFAALPENHLRRVSPLFSVERFKDGDTVVLAGARGDSLYIILNGRARVRLPGGHTRPLGADDCFGELSLLDGAPRSATVSAVGELTTATAGRKDFQKMLKSEPGMAIGILEGLTRTVRDMQKATAV